MAADARSPRGPRARVHGSLWTAVRRGVLGAARRGRHPPERERRPSPRGEGRRRLSAGQADAAGLAAVPPPVDDDAAGADAGADGAGVAAGVVAAGSDDDDFAPARASLR